MVVLLAAGAGLTVLGGRHRSPAGAAGPVQPFSVAASDLPAEPSSPPSEPAADTEPAATGTAARGTAGGASSSLSRLQISSLQVDAPVLEEPIKGTELTLPANVHQVAHWNGGGALSGAVGTVVIAGHVNYAGQGNGALYDLGRVRAGATVRTLDARGAASSWRVTSVRVIEKAALPQDIFTAAGPRRLVLITCGGPLLHVDDSHGGYNSYRDNVIVTAVPA